MDELKFRAVIPEHNCKIFFTLEDLVTEVIKPFPKFSIREVLIPWLLNGNKPDQFIGLHDCKDTEIYEKDIIEKEVWFPRDDPARGGYFDYGVVIYEEDGFFVESDADFYDNMGINFS